MTNNVINLSKGEKINLSKMDTIDLSKGGKGLRKVEVGLGWDAVGIVNEAAPVEKGLFGKLKSMVVGSSTPSPSRARDIDCDAFAYLASTNGKISDTKNVVWYGNLETPNRTVKHSGDNLVGGSTGDDEQIVVNLSTLGQEVDKVVIGVNIYQGKSRGQHFGMLQNAYIRVVDSETSTELCRFKLDKTYDGATSLFFGELVRHGNDWEFLATGEVAKDGNIMDILKDKM